ncbi:hypothetical protein ERO13_A13G130801v2 [Gossypium hirsutum]|uniref:Raptor N-terminal CASPase-like domain-containing protein n=2 Tax=Gossypium TaxID=3633 RepID=A0A5D2MKR8_GOSTO|nr:hypothetical protein ERO13_A13G130801v2 [Gossypium hirsutum]TYG86711.1 hypothetical protein ES288_A13G155100v1 [Gossypium darwinii]TYH92087.1 hypothetical protein ES332_A13G158000v1 [Gossypium tomentosum]
MEMKTGCLALVLCLNISVDPPDVIKLSPCARMECWTGMFFESILSYFLHFCYLMVIEALMLMIIPQEIFNKFRVILICD